MAEHVHVKHVLESSTISRYEPDLANPKTDVLRQRSQPKSETNSRRFAKLRLSCRGWGRWIRTNATLNLLLEPTYCFWAPRKFEGMIRPEKTLL